MREPALDDEAKLTRLLGEVSQLKAAVQREGEALIESQGVAVAGSAARARAENLSQYITLRGHALTPLQYRLAARGFKFWGTIAIA